MRERLLRPPYLPKQLAPCGDIGMAIDKSAASTATTLLRVPGTAGIAPERLPDIAIEVERLCGAVRAAAPALGFDHEPSFFAATLNNRAP